MQRFIMNHLNIVEMFIAKANQMNIDKNDQLDILRQMVLVLSINDYYCYYYYYSSHKMTGLSV